MVPTDNELLALARTGDREAYSELYRRYSASGQRFATSLTGDPARAADLVSEAFIKIMSLLDDGRGPDSNFNSYLLTAIRNVMIDDLRRHRREELVDDVTTYKPGEEEVVEDYAESLAEATVVNQAFASLPQRWRDVLWYTEVLDEPLETVAARFGIKRNAVGVLSWRAREGFRQAYLAEHLAASTDPDCRKLAPQIPQYVREQLTPARVDELERHLETCDICPVAVADLAGINTNLGALVAPAMAFAAIGSAHGGTGLLSGLARNVTTKVAAAAGLAAVATVAVVALHSGMPAYPPTPTAAESPPSLVQPSGPPRPRTAPVRSTAPAPVRVIRRTNPSTPAARKPSTAPGPKVVLAQPDVIVVSTSQTKAAHVITAAGPAGRSLTVTIAISNATGFAVSSGAWSCRVTSASTHSVGAVCASTTRSSGSGALEFDVAIPDPMTSAVGTITAHDGTHSLSRRFSVSPSSP